MGAGSVLGRQWSQMRTNMDQHGVKIIRKGEPKAYTNGVKGTNKVVFEECATGDKQKHENDVQKSLVPGHPTPLGAVGPDLLVPPDLC